MKDTSTKILGLVSGYGAGKTYVVARKAVQLSLLNPGCDGLITEPTFPLLDQILIPELKSALEEFQVDYTYVGGTFHLNINGQKSRIIPKSMESWERLIGINAAYVILDEFDTTRASIAYKAFIKLLGRLRVGTVRQMVIVSTPEGFGAMHRIFVDEADPKQKKLIQASTLDNHHLPEDYIETMRSQYPAELIEAYLNGKFVNLTQGSVYGNYDRSANDTSRVDDFVSDLHIGVDFNVGHMSAVVCLFKDQNLYAVKEFKDYFDTPALIEAIEDYAETRKQGNIYVYPDASGKNRATNDGSQTNHKLLRAAGFVVRVDSRNPKVQDRVNTVNSRFKAANNEVRLFVNISEAPELVKGLEQQSYDDNGKPDKSTGIDHQLDAFGYVVSYLMPILPNRHKKRTNFSNEPHAN